MSATAEIVWLSQDESRDAMGEFGAEDASAAEPVAPRTFNLSVARAPYAVPTPPPEPPSSIDKPVPVPAAEPAPPEVAAPVAVQRGRWFVGVAVLGLLTLVQAPFVVLWALQSATGSAPIAIQVVTPPIPFASAPPVPVERALPPPPPRPAPVAARPAPPGSLSGWLKVDAAVPLRITEDGRLLGTTDVDRLMLPTGEHVLDLRTEDLQFSTRQTITVRAGETTTIPVRLPSAAISINAKPWAEVWVDGERVGDTPIGTLMRTIGRHEVVLRHPEFGERRVPVTITLAQPARVIVDFRAGK